MRKYKWGIAAALVLSAMVMNGCGKAGETQTQVVSESADAGNTGKNDRVVVVMGVSSEPESGFDP
ncbi:MAG: ABC transporter substrate-binding protein, partial [Lacrimispora sphenoides]